MPPVYKCIETPTCHSKQTKELMFIKLITGSANAYMMNISIKSQLHRANGFCGNNILSIVFFHFFCIMVSMATINSGPKIQG